MISFKKIEKELASSYLQIGVKNTLSIDLDPQAVHELIGFKRLKLIKREDSSAMSKSVRSFKLPLWKRVFDITFASCAIIGLSPLLILTALAIRVESRGTIIYVPVLQYS